MGEGVEPWRPTAPAGGSVDELSLAEWVGQALGSASMCWADVGAASVFDSTRCSWVFDGLMARINNAIVDAVAAGEAPGVSEVAPRSFVTESGAPGVWMGRGKVGVFLACAGPDQEEDLLAPPQWCTAWAIVAGRTDPDRPIGALIDAGWTYRERRYRCPDCS